MAAPVRYIPNFIENHEDVFTALWNELSWEQRSPARKEYWTNTFNRSYTYGKRELRTYESQRTHPYIEEVTDKLEDFLGFRYEGCFLNGYAAKENALGWHADDDPAIDHSCPIAVVTVGEGRNIDFMVKGDKSTKESVFLASGSLLLMESGMQDTHFHQIPPAGYIIKKPRISLTHRKLFA